MRRPPPLRSPALAQRSKAPRAPKRHGCEQRSSPKLLIPHEAEVACGACWVLDGACRVISRIFWHGQRTQKYNSRFLVCSLSIWNHYCNLPLFGTWSSSFHVQCAPGLGPKNRRKQRLRRKAKKNEQPLPTKEQYVPPQAHNMDLDASPKAP